MHAKRQDLTNSLGLLVLRLGFGCYMVTHGWGKLQMLLDGKADTFGDPLEMGNTLSLILAMGAEFGCALLVIIGFATRFAAAPIVFTMGVAALVVHQSDPWTMQRAAELFLDGDAKTWGSKEPALLFMTAFLALIFTGAGRISVDGLIWPAWRKRRARQKDAT